MFKLKVNSTLNLVLTFSLIAIISAYFIEYALGHQPCNLCLIERIPYILSIILIISNYIIKKDEKFIILLLIMIFVFSFLISVYHFGIEQSFFEESLICELKSEDNIISKEELLNLLSKRMISCKDVTFMIFGLSLTTINIIVSFLITYLLLITYISYEKNKS